MPRRAEAHRWILNNRQGLILRLGILEIRVDDISVDSLVPLLLFILGGFSNRMYLLVGHVPTMEGVSSACCIAFMADGTGGRCAFGDAPNAGGISAWDGEATEPGL